MQDAELGDDMHNQPTGLVLGKLAQVEREHILDKIKRTLLSLDLKMLMPIFTKLPKQEGHRDRKLYMI